MSTTKRFVLPIAGVAILASYSVAQLGNIDWPKHFRDLGNTARSPGVAPQAPVLRWSSSLPTYYIMAAPTVVGNVVIVPTSESTSDAHGRAFQLDGQTGYVLWQYANPSVALGNKGTAALTVDGKTYFGGDDGFVYCLGPSGSPAWATAIATGPSMHSPVPLSDGTVIVSHTAQFGASGGLARLTSDGSLMWHNPLAKYVSLSPAVSENGTIYVGEATGWGGPGSVVAMASSGYELWRYPVAPALTVSPVVRSDGAVLIGLQNGRLACVSSSGVQVWQSPVIGNPNEGFFGPSFLSDGRIVVGTGSGMLFLLSSDGQSVLWRKEVGIPWGGNAGPCVDAMDRVLYGTNQGVFCFSPDGTQEWLFATTTPVSGGPVLADNGAVYFCTWGSTVYCLEPVMANRPPSANAGADQVVSSQGGSGTEIVLDGSGSSDPDGDGMIYTWTGPFVEGGGVSSGVGPIVTLPVGNHVVRLTVSDGQFESSDTVVITMINDPPIADAGPDRVVACTGLPVTMVTLDGSRSSDPNGDELTYTWTGAFGTVTGLNPVVELPIGASSITLTVGDGDFESTDTVTIWVSVRVEGFLPPMAELVPDGAPDVPMPPHAMKKGRTIPLKLRMYCGTRLLTDADVPPPAIVGIWRNGDAVNLSVIDPDPGEANDNGTLFRFSEDKWIFNLSTAWASAGRYEITVRMPDGSVYRSAFELR